jgi:hypothetical protein
LRREPRTVGVAPRTRWTLATLLAACPWLRLRTPAGLHGLLDRLDISYQRARDYVRSPDADYEAKLAAVAAAVATASEAAGTVVAVYLDELTYYRQPSLAATYGARGDQPRAQRSYAANTVTRVLGTLDPRDGRVVAWQGSKVDARQLVRFYRQLRQAYPAAQRLYVIQDNWPVHFHPDVLAALEPQETPFPLRVPPHWSRDPSPTAQQGWGDWRLPIQLVPLPTYASWCNPIEKLWRWGKQEVLHLHAWADQLTALRQAFRDFLARFATGSQELLRYTGLLLNA